MTAPSGMVVASIAIAPNKNTISPLQDGQANWNHVARGGGVASSM
jgi:hypothetical protein